MSDRSLANDINTIRKLLPEWTKHSFNDIRIRADNVDYWASQAKAKLGSLKKAKLGSWVLDNWETLQSWNDQWEKLKKACDAVARHAYEKGIRARPLLLLIERGQLDQHNEAMIVLREIELTLGKPNHRQDLQDKTTSKDN